MFAQCHTWLLIIPHTSPVSLRTDSWVRAFPFIEDHPVPAGCAEPMPANFSAQKIVTVLFIRVLPILLSYTQKVHSSMKWGSFTDSLYYLYLRWKHLGKTGLASINKFVLLTFNWLAVFYKNPPGPAVSRLTRSDVGCVRIIDTDDNVSADWQLV